MDSINEVTLKNIIDLLEVFRFNYKNKFHAVTPRSFYENPSAKSSTFPDSGYKWKVADFQPLCSINL
jgi:hypothetical protein